MVVRESTSVSGRWGKLWLAVTVVLAGLGAAAPAARSPRMAPARPAAAASAAACTNVVGDSDFELAPPAISPWVEASVPPTVTLSTGGFFPDVISPLPITICEMGVDCPAKLVDPDTDLPGYAAPAGPHSGVTWAWFGGGITDTETITQVMQSVSQPVTLTSGARGGLDFDLWISRADPGTGVTDTLQALIGTTPVFTATAAYTTPYAAGYTPVSVDVSGLGQSLGTTLTFSATTQARQNLLPPIVNFNVDDVRLCVTYFTHLPLISR